MSKFRIKVVETLQRVVEVEADNFEDARQHVEEQYRKSEIVLDEGDFTGETVFALDGVEYDDQD